MTPREARRATHGRTRIAALVGFVALAGALLVAPGGPGPRGAAAARPRGHLPTHAAKLEVAGRSSFRTLARRETVGRQAKTAPIPGRLGWQRPGRAGSGGTTDGGGGTTGGLATTAGAVTTAVAALGTSGVTAMTAALATAAAGGPGVVGTAWNGLTDQAIGCGSSRPCVEPPDPWVAVSSTHVVQMVNQSTRITSRTGGAAKQVRNVDFFGVSTWDATAFAADPRVLYDPAHDRWVATMFAGTCKGGALFIAVSDTGDPTGTWQTLVHEFPGQWPDFPTLGYSSNLVGVGVNVFDITCGTGGSYLVGAYQGASLIVMDWADLLDGGSATIHSTTPEPAAFTYAPAAGLTPSDDLHAVVALADGSRTTADLGYTSVSGTIVGNDLAVATPVNLAALPLAKLQPPPTPVDAGGLIGVQHNALDLRPTDAVWRDGRLGVASTTSCLRGTTYRPCGRVIELATKADLSTPTLRQDLLIAPTSGYSDTFVPGVGYGDDGTLWTVFSQGGTGRYVSSWARRQVPAAAPGAWSPGVALVAAGRGPYGGTAGAGLNQRWGDYVGVARDPAEPGSVWQANQMADTGGGWATRVARLGDDSTPPVLTGPQPSFVAASTAGTSGIPVRIAWGASDAGSGVGSMRLERSVNGGAFTGVALSSPTAQEVTLPLSYGVRYRFRVRATDNAGNAMVDPVVGPSFTPIVYSESSYRVSYSGRWYTTRSSSFLGGVARYASARYRRATLSFTGMAVAWVSAVGRTRGSARVFVDGALLNTFSTYRSSGANRRVIAGRAFATAGGHSFRVEVVGTSGHPRVDLDAFVVLR
jgi:hypothetical protein